MIKLEHSQIATDLKICRILNGMWQVSGAHGVINAEEAVDEMFAYVDAGFTSWDLADHYGPAEDLVGNFIGKFKQSRGAQALSDLQFFTKWVPRPGLVTRRSVEQSIDRSLRRMNVESLDLLQFHWWDYADDNYLRALEHLTELRREGKIKHLSLTNFDTEHVDIITQQGIEIVTNQVQYSLVDLRPALKMAQFCQQHKIGLLTYGTLCGGLFSQKYLAQPEPGRLELDTASLRKYKQMIDAWGGWNLFQELLVVLNDIAKKHNVTIANVATRYILDRPAVAGVIIGARLSVSQHIDDNKSVFALTLDEEDLNRINMVLIRSKDLFNLIGDCGDEYRR